jgi:hypothetical protein
MAQGLGWFSIALGLMEVMAPRKLARTLGMEEHEKTIFGYGVREIATGVAILAAKDPTPWIWGRVGGDALDIATLAAGMHADNPKRQNVTYAMAAVLGATAADIYCAQALSRDSATPLPPVHDYRDRTGFPQTPAAMRGAARDFDAPRDFKTPEALRPWNSARPTSARGRIPVGTA